MDGTAPTQQQQQQRHRISKPNRKKLARLPPDAKVTKRPLFRPAIPSPYAGASQQKVIYISARTPFMSAVKRVEKLLHIADTRLVQSATTLAKQNNSKRKRSGRNEDEIMDIAREVERLKAKKQRTGPGAVEEGAEEDNAAGEAVTLKGTGKAIARVMELGLWFQQREEYAVQLRTGSVGAIDDIEIDDAAEEHHEYEKATSRAAEEGSSTAAKPSADTTGVADAEAGANEDDDDAGGGVSLEGYQKPDDAQPKPVQSRISPVLQEKDDIPETRIRYTSVLEVAVSLH